MLTSKKEHEIICQLFERYEALINIHSEKMQANSSECSALSLASLCAEAISNGMDYPFDKLNRWLGFIQGVLTMNSIITVADEREFTRPILHALHEHKIPTFDSSNK